MTRPFRFGVVATPDPVWTTTARRVEELGYSSLLVPDGLHLLAPFPSLATAAAVTTTLRVGTFVLASPLRTPRAAAWEAHSLAVLSGGRFDLGIGTGHGGVPAAAAQLGMLYGSAAQRRQQVVDTIAHVRSLDAAIPILIAAGGPKMLAIAAELADVVTLATDPLATREEVAALAAGLRDRVEIAMNLFVVGDEVPEWTRRFIGADAAALIAADSLVMLRGSTVEMADELQRRRDAFGASAVTVNGAFLEQFAPVVERLTGRWTAGGRPHHRSAASRADRGAPGDHAGGMDVVALLHSGWLLPLLAALVMLDGPFPVVPSEPLLMTAAAVAAGLHDVPVMAGLFVVAFAGSVTGDLLLFTLGRSSRRFREPGDSAVSRWVRRGIERRPAVTIVGARFLPGGRLVSTVAAGRFGLTRAQFVAWSLVSSAAWSAYMMGVGLLLGPLTGGDPIRGLLAGLAMAAVTGGTFALIQRLRRPVPTTAETSQTPGAAEHDRRRPHPIAPGGAELCDAQRSWAPRGT